MFRTSNTSTLIYAIVFQAGWFACIMGGDFVSLIYALTFLILHLWFASKPKHNFFVYSSVLKKESCWLLIVFAFGFAIETLVFSAGLLYVKQNPHPVMMQKFFENFIIPPIWLLSLWLTFAIALRTCLSFLLNHALPSFILCIVFVPLNYYAGANLNSSVGIAQPSFISLALITFLWLVFFGILIKIKRHYFEGLFNA